MKRRQITIGRTLIIIAIAITAIAFLMNWYPGMVLEFFRQGHPFERFALALFVLIFFPPLVERFGLPGILGLILGGVLLGPHVLRLGGSTGDVAVFLSEMGRVFLMFLIGLEINLQDFRKQAVASSVFGLATFAVPMTAGVAVGLAFGYGTNAAILIGSLMASHTLLGLPVLEKFGLVNSRFALATIGATIFTDIAALLVLAVCLSVHISGVFSPAHLAWLVFQLAVYCVLVLGAIPWIGRAYLSKHKDEASQFSFVMLAVIVAAIGAKLIELEDIVGAFLCGIAINSVLEHGEAREKLEFMGKTFFVPLFFLLVGVGLDLKMFRESLSTQLPFVLAIVAALIAGKLVAAVIAQLAARYTWNEGLGMWSLSLPQLAATLAAALTAFQTKNAAGERSINETVLSAVIVLMVVTATLGPILTQRFARRISQAAETTGGIGADRLNSLEFVK